MQNMKKYKETLDFCDSVQHKKDVQGWTTLREFNYSSQNKAFDAKVYKQNNRIVIAFAGSETPNDYYNDAVILGGYIPSQYYEAEKLYNNVKAKYANSNIETVGYSLGGTISNLLSHRTGIPSNAVAPIGSMHIVQKNKDYFPYSDSNITTYGRLGDVLFSQNLTKQSGTIYIVPDLPNEQVEKRLPKVENHYLHNFTPYNLYQSKIYKNGQVTGKAASIEEHPHIFSREEIGKMTQEEFARNEATIMEQLKNGQIIDEHKQKSYGDFVSPDSNVVLYTREDIANMSTEEFTKHEKAIRTQMNKIGIPSKRELPQNTKTYSSDPKNGKWVTINGNHVFIDK